MTLAVLALILAAVLAASRDFVGASSATIDSVRLDAALDAGVATAVRDLSAPGASGGLRAPESFTMGDIVVTVSARAESSKISLRSADPALLSALLRVSGIAPQKADRIADEIADWRDADNDARPQGAELSDYLAAGLPQRPRNGPFASVQELSLLLKGDEDLSRCLEPDVSVFAAQNSVTLAQASDRVRQAVAMIDPAKGAARTVPGFGDSIAAPADIYEVSVTARSPAMGAGRSRLLVMRVTGSQDRPFWLLSMRSPPPLAEETRRACERFAARN